MTIDIVIKKVCEIRDSLGDSNCPELGMNDKTINDLIRDIPKVNNAVSHAYGELDQLIYELSTNFEEG